MNTPEGAKPDIKTQVNDEFWKGQLAATESQADPVVRAVARFLLGANERGELLQNRDVINKLTIQSLQRFVGFNPTQRVQLIMTVFPHFHATVLHALEIFPRFPYPTGGYRQAFRIPGQPQVTDPLRFRWLAEIAVTLRPYPYDIQWVTRWAPYLRCYDNRISILLAAAMEMQDQTAESIFTALTTGTALPDGSSPFGRHTIVALLMAEQPRGWEFVEKLLISAQRDEGLRQSILEVVDEAHPDAYIRMLRIILEHGLVRFASVARAVCVWFGFIVDAMQGKMLEHILEVVLKYLTDPAARALALQSADTLETYLALWCGAFENLMAALPAARKIITDTTGDRRLAGASFLAHCQVPAASEVLGNMVEDSDPRVAALGLMQCARRSTEGKKGVFDRLIRQIEVLPVTAKVISLSPLPVPAVSVSRELAADALVGALESRSPLELVAYMPKMSISGRTRSMDAISEINPPNAAVREVLVHGLQDGASDVRSICLKALEKSKLEPSESQAVETLLSRKADDLRCGCLTLLATLPDDAATDSAQRLITTGDDRQRSAGIELTTLLYKANRRKEQCREMARNLTESRTDVSSVERRLLAIFDQPEVAELTLADSLGLALPADRTWPAVPQLRNVQFVHDSTVLDIQALDALIDQHAQTPVIPWRYDGKPGEETLLGNLRGFTYTIARPITQQQDQFLLREIWMRWFDQRPSGGLQSDGHDLGRLMNYQAGLDNLKPEVLAKPDLGCHPKLKYPDLVESIIRWITMTVQPDSLGFLLDCFETLCAQMPREYLTKQPDASRGFLARYLQQEPLWRDYRGFINRSRFILEFHFNFLPEKWTPELMGRYFRLLRWIDEPGVDIDRKVPDLKVVLKAFAMGVATRADVIDALLGGNWHQRTKSGQFYEFGRISSRKLNPLVQAYPALTKIVAEIRHHAIGIELNRGELPTPATPLVTHISYTGDLTTLIGIMQVLDTASLSRNNGFNPQGRVEVLSRLAQRTSPEQSDTPELFAQVVKQKGINEDQLLPLAFYAPQWGGHVEAVLKWPGLEDGVYWIHAHTKGQDWRVDSELKEQWNANIRLRTEIPAEDLMDGAVDVTWFVRVYKILGSKRWRALYDAAKFASSGTGHARAKLFAAAMLNEVKERDLTAKITSKRNQDALRSLGLIPVPENQQRAGIVERRYRVIQDFLRSGKKFGRQRQASERRAAEIGLSNLARSAGYRDPMRLGWAMEARASADLRSGPVCISENTYSVALTLDSQGFPKLAIAKSGKQLKSIPSAIKKNPAIAALVQRKDELEKSRRRMTLGLESAMCRGDEFSRHELMDLLANPQVKPLLESLLLINGDVLGYLTADGMCLRKSDGDVEPLSKIQPIRIAHPSDLFLSKQWSNWQHDCFTRQQTQPFKQIFREFYPLTQTEQEAINQSRRYAGHQLNARQALAVLGARGWIVKPDTGIFKVYYDVGLVAWLSFQKTFMTPAEVDGLTIESVIFTRRSDAKLLELTEIPVRLFSETMRDLDLLVAVAHRGGVDPEASASTVEMRGKLINETMLLLHLHHVTVEGRFAIIVGKLGRYNVHLGSGNVQMQPGGALEIVAVQAQGRGRIFLPFADDDPKTAEVISKVLLLARDQEIKDPRLLEQIRRA